jgi:YgiT-type zinc finger domain-containing protein
MSAEQTSGHESRPPAEDTDSPVCPKCGDPMTATMVRTAFWRNDRPAIVEDIPAHACGRCMENFYDAAVSDALRRLAERGFPAAEAKAHVVVPVFSLEGQLTPRTPLPDDCYLD